MSCVLVLGFLGLVLNLEYVESSKHGDHGNRVKRFLFNKVAEPHISYGAVTLCCECNDFEEANSCYDKCKTESGEVNFKLCMGTLCSTTATLVNDRFYLVASCANESTCSQDRNTYSATKGCHTLSKPDMANGTKCGYCCQDPDLRVHGTNYSQYCTKNLNNLIAHTYGQHTDSGTTLSTRAVVRTCLSSTTTTTTTAPPKTTTQPKTTTGQASNQQSGILDIYKLCRSAVAKSNTYYLAYPGDETKFIQCDENGFAFLMSCSPTLIWNNNIKDCAFKDQVYTHTATTKYFPSSATTIQMKTRSTVHTKTTQAGSTLSTNSNDIRSTSNSSAEALSVSSPTSKIPTKQPTNHFTPAPIPGYSCHTCTDEKHCYISSCQSRESHCINVIQINPNGTQTVIKKSCASYIECKFDHSLRNNLCERSVNGTLTTNSTVICQYCCSITNSLSPCNIYNIPAKVDWFQDSSSSTQTPGTTAASSAFNSTLQSASTATTFTSLANVNTTSVGQSLNNSSPTLSTISSRTSTNASSNSTSPGLSNASATLEISSAVSTKTSILHTLVTPTSPSTAKDRSPYTLPPKTTRCNVCSGPDFLCEKLFVETDCKPPNNYCINTVSNKRDGTRLVNRRCDNFQRCYLDWFLGSSDSDKCRKFDEKQILTLQFDCTYCCIKDGCNLSLRPSAATLYKNIN